MRKILAFILSFAIFCCAFTVTAVDNLKTVTVPVTGNCKSSAAAEVLGLVNKERTKRGYSALMWDSTLEKAAFKRAVESSVKFAHVRPNDADWYTVNNSAIVKRFPTSGENLAAGSDSAKEAVKGWMNSEGHRENILNNNFTHIGVSCVKINGVLYWAQSFGGADRGKTKKAGLKKRFTVAVRVVKHNTKFIIGRSENEWKDNYKRIAKMRVKSAKNIKLLAYDSKDCFVPAKLALNKFKLSSSDKKVLRVSKSGKIRALKKGAATVTATLKSNKLFKISSKIRVS